MSSSPRGSQKPRVAVEPPRVDSDGPDAALLVSTYGGFDLDEWQCLCLDAWLGRDDADKYTATSNGLAVPRQNGKNAVLEGRELYGMAVNGEKILHTAHRVDTARKSFLRLVRFFENPRNTDLTELVETVRRTNGQESITLKNGGLIEFSSRVNGGARGSTYDVVVFDEAQELTDDQMEAIMSTMAAAPSGNRQLIYTGTPPSPVSPGTVFKRIRKSALEGTSAKVAWHEWSVEEIGDITDKSRWYATNPALGIRLDEEFTAAECATLTKEGFARERLGWWEEASQGTNPAIPKAAWEACESEEPEPTDDERIAFGVKFTPDGHWYALSVASKAKGRPIALVGIEYEPVDGGGLKKLADWIVERKGRCAMCAIDGKSNTAALYRKLLDEGMPKKAICIMSTDGVCAAASMLVNAIDERAVSHSGQPAMTASALAAQKRKIGDNGGFGFGDGAESCALIESAALANWAVSTTKRNPGRRLRVG